MRQLLAVPFLLLIAAAQTLMEAPPSDAMTHTVEIRNFAFAPARLEVATGDTVVWINRDAAPHTATDSLARWDSGELGAGDRWTWVASEGGRFIYLCAYHPSMRGTLEVLTTRAVPVEHLESIRSTGGDVQQDAGVKGSRRHGW